MERRPSRAVTIRDVVIGGGHPILVQSMTNTDTRDVEATVAQIHRLEKAGCELIRVAVLNMDAAQCLNEIKKRISLPLVADIHFDHRLALEAIRQGVSKVRLNPGNITKPEKIKEVVRAAQDANIPIRVGVNSGSLAKEILIKHEGATPEAMVESALNEIEILESLNFQDIVISLKSTDVRVMIDSNRLMTKHVKYPLHLGVTEAGLGEAAIAKSALGIGTLLEEGIGDTLRVSLTGDSVQEVKVAFDILGALGLRWRGVQFTACPTCGRIGINLEKIVAEAQERLKDVETPLKVSLIGCVVNGIGEAGHSHIGLVGQDKAGVLYKDGKPVKRVPEEEIVDELCQMVFEYERELIHAKRLNT
ncbi:MAG: 4-hydroxy-3-methylbut-2-en-1-yl diphosphate synthase [Candidatus Fraserbacteria bacterium RBG_16_55_9]|uniref:4-hydroxy-3-methylbut-2-en-1-yl diphosphate synthase (flavodoxin) n=1 Tax=Fraserbacteria sp. (strain RBG_16_55_9) TaxID=1817864 RepID=A0A1F5URC9_FRAXR|nr:MAG: 4-hydroxy-3-methylbut-2-en-1-yl diphosphate synthase [Candidatus Fraserbacteria bacterium RBG_16_55_9]